MEEKGIERKSEGLTDEEELAVEEAMQEELAEARKRVMEGRRLFDDDPRWNDNSNIPPGYDSEGNPI